MSRVLLDTNILVSVLTDRDLEQQARASEIFEMAATGKVRILLHQIVISELVYVLSNLYRVRAEKVAAILSDLLATPGVETVAALSWPRVLDLWPRRVADFGDAALAAAALEKRNVAIATFDQRFIRQLRREGVDSFPAVEGRS